MSAHASTIDLTVTADPRAEVARGAARARADAAVTAERTRPRAPAPAPGAAGDLRLPMRFMVIGLGTLALLVLVYPWHIDLLRGSFYDPHLLTFVHVNTLGLIGAVIFGASYQMLPIVLQTPLAAPRSAHLSWWLYLPGLIAFVVGLGHGPSILLGLGGTLTFVAIGLYVRVVVGTLLTAPARDVTWWHVLAATTALATGATLGLLLALSKQVGFLAGFTLPILAAHVVLMLGGWVTPLLTGVAYRLVSMFTLTEDRVRADWAAVELELTAGGAWTVAASLLLDLGPFVTVAGAAALLAGLLLFAGQIARLYLLRLRRSPDVHIPFVLVSMGSGLAAAGLLTWGFTGGRGPADPVWIVVGWLAIVGWAETAIQGFLYKIGPFLTWLHRYGPVAGVQPVPMLEALYSRRLALVGCAAWTTGLVLGAVTPLTTAEWVPLGAAVGLSLGGATTIVNAVRVARHWLGRSSEW
ncbi:MAG TPA: hypothetical protein VFH48_34595 [Chloroflexota bacterium]|nr:hypothetical protein [Chloroflexota bacterium]